MLTWNALVAAVAIAVLRGVQPAGRQVRGDDQRCCSPVILLRLAAVLLASTPSARSGDRARAHEPRHFAWCSTPAQQLSQSVGVALGALALETVLRFKGQHALVAADFPPAFLLVALVSASEFKVALFARMPPDAGAEMADRRPAAAGPDDEKKAA